MTHTRPARARRLRTATAAATAIAALALAACGSEVADRATTAAPAATTTAVTTPPASTVPPATTPPPTAPPTTSPTSAPVTSGPDVDAARAVIDAYVDAFRTADGQRACDQLTPASQQAFLAAVQGQVTASSCADAFTQVAQQVPQDQREAFGAATVTDLQVTGDSASGILTVQGISNDFTLTRLAGAWKIANLPGS